jgi:hypothetical protein
MFLEMNNIKTKTYEEILKYYYKTKNIDKFLEVCRKILESNNSSPLMRGELAEVVLIALLEEFIEKHNLKSKGWFVSKGMILKDLENPKSAYTTELDITLFTPKQIILFECKSYKGKKQLRDKCSLYKRKNKGGYDLAIDVYSQHTKHLQALNKYLYKFQLESNAKKKPYKIVLFDFSDGELEDVREDKYKRIFQYVNEKTIYSIFNDYNTRPVLWSIEHVRKVVEVIDKSSEKLTSVHLDYVSSLNHSRNKN